METKIKNALTEVYTILNKLDFYSKIPTEFRNYIENNRNKNYSFNFNENMPLFNQITNENTRLLISYIYMKYINTSSEESEFYEQEINEILAKINN
jgi:hypothetical protein